METKEFGNELRRMFRSLGGQFDEGRICEGIICSECPFNVKEQGAERCMLIFERIDEVIDVVTAWSKGNPRKTNKEVFLKAFPDAPLRINGFPLACAHLLGLVSHCDGHTSCAECWNREYKGALKD